MSKFPFPGKGAKKVPFPAAPEAPKSKAPPMAPAGGVVKRPAPTPPGGYKPGLSGQQYDGDPGKDYSAMRPKLATKDKIMNPIKSAIGLPGKAPKMVPKKPGK